MSYSLKRTSVTTPTPDKRTHDKRTHEAHMSLLQTRLLNGGNMLSQEFDEYFQAQEEKAATQKVATKAGFQAKKSNEICRRTRTSSSVPASINGSIGITRDISSSGVFVVQSTRFEVGSKIDCLIDVDTSGSKMKLCCEGIVVRVERVDGRFGIGVKILSQTTMH